MKILVLGAGGMAGHVIALHLAEVGHDVTTLSGTRRLSPETHLVDVTSKATFVRFLDNLDFDIVVNAIGVLVEKSEREKAVASYVNAYLPHLLEERYAESNTRLIHLSTDCVFSGQTGGYKEDAYRDGESFYDRSKALGELDNQKDLTLRMSIVGPELSQGGSGLFNWFFTQSGVISGYTRSRWNGVTTPQLAKGIESAIEQKLSGVYHFVPEQSVSKYELLQLFAVGFGRPVRVKPVEGPMIDKTLRDTRREIAVRIPPYPEMIAEMRVWMEGHGDLYKHYGF